MATQRWYLWAYNPSKQQMSLSAKCLEKTTGSLSGDNIPVKSPNGQSCSYKRTPGKRQGLPPKETRVSRGRDSLHR